MTREELIKTLKDWKPELELMAKYNDNSIDYQRYRALDEAIKALEQQPNIDMDSEEIKILQKRSYLEGFHEALKMSVEQEPCEDCISRKALLEEIENGIKAGNYEEGYEEYPHINDMDDIIECIKYADSVQPKTGHWIAEENEEMEIVGYFCSECDLPMETEQRTDFCPNCGCRMVEPQETETWNGYHGQITAPKGTFKKIYEDAESEGKE